MSFVRDADETSKETDGKDVPWDEEGLAESIAYNKRVYDTFRGGEDGMLGVRKKKEWVQNLGGSGLDIARHMDGSVTIIDNFESVQISEEHLGVIGSYLVRLHEDD